MFFNNFEGRDVEEVTDLIKKVLVIAVLLLTVAMLAAPVMAIGPNTAVEKGKNPNLSGGPGPGGSTLAFLDTPSDTSILFITRQDNPDLIFFLMTASRGKGRMNNAIVASGANWMSIAQNPDDYANKWIYLSGESGGNTWDKPNDNPDVGSHGMLYWQLRAMGIPHTAAYEDALMHPDGVYRQLVIVPA